MSAMFVGFGDLISGLNETQLRRWDTSSPWYRTFHGRFPFDWQFSAQQPSLVVQRRRETREINGCIDDLCPPGSKIKSYLLRVDFFRQNVWRGGACCGSSVWSHLSFYIYCYVFVWPPNSQPRGREHIKVLSTQRASPWPAHPNQRTPSRWTHRSLPLAAL